jgi:hypothetical protein
MSSILARLAVVAEIARTGGGYQPSVNEDEKDGDKVNKKDKDRQIPAMLSPEEYRKVQRKLVRPDPTILCHETFVTRRQLTSLVWAKVADLRSAYFFARIADPNDAVTCN